MVDRLPIPDTAEAPALLAWTKAQIDQAAEDTYRQFATDVYSGRIAALIIGEKTRVVTHEEFYGT